MHQTLPQPDEARCISILQDVIRIKSYSETQGEIEATSHMCKLMVDLGLEAEFVKFDGGKRQNAIGKWRGTGGGEHSHSKRLLFNGHLDTNPVGEGWTVDPWGALVKDDMIYGIGVSNMKSGCCAYYCAVETLIRAGWKPKSDVTLTFVVGELQQGVGTEALINQGKCDCDVFVNCEPSDLKAITTHAESSIFRIELTGMTRHMSKREDATDALLAAADLIPLLDATTFPNAKDEDTEACNRCSVGVTRGGLGREMADWRPPQVADFAILRGSARTGPGQTREDVMAGLTTACESTRSRFPELKYEVILENGENDRVMPAFTVPKDAFIVRRLNEAYELVRPEQKQPTGALAPQCFYGSDAGHLYKKLGLEGIVCGPGGKYNTMADERVELVDYLDCIKMFIALIVNVCG